MDKGNQQYTITTRKDKTYYIRRQKGAVCKDSEGSKMIPKRIVFDGVENPTLPVVDEIKAASLIQIENAVKNYFYRFPKHQYDTQVFQIIQYEKFFLAIIGRREGPTFPQERLTSKDYEKVPLKSFFRKH